MSPMDWSGLYGQFLDQLVSVLNWVSPLLFAFVAISFAGTVIGILLGVFSRKGEGRSVRVTMGDDGFWTTESGLSRMRSGPGVLVTKGKPTRSVIHYLDEDTGVELGSEEMGEYEDKAL